MDSTLNASAEIGFVIGNTLIVIQGVKLKRFYLSYIIFLLNRENVFIGIDFLSTENRRGYVAIVQRCLTSQIYISPTFVNILSITNKLC